MDWTLHFPEFVNPDTSKTNLSGARELLKDVEVVDIGCGYGGLLVGLAPLLPETLMVGQFGTFSFYEGLMEKKLTDNRHGNSHAGPRLSTNPHPSPSIPAEPTQKLLLYLNTTTRTHIIKTTRSHHRGNRTRRRRLPQHPHPRQLRKHLRNPQQHHEIPPQLLRQAPALQNLHLLPRPAL